jgi:hypothetical protein
VSGRQRGEAEEVQRDVVDFMARFNCFGRRRPRRTDNGGALAVARASVGAGDGGSDARQLEQGLGHAAHGLLVL